LLGQILQFVVIEVATKPHRGQDHDRPRGNASNIT
jgi:hypothetical protein